MQSSLIDRKLSILYDRYKDREIVNSAQKDVEDIRRKALYVGAATSGAIFFANEAVRLTQRSRKLNINEFAYTILCYFKVKEADF